MSLPIQMAAVSHDVRPSKTLLLYEVLQNSCQGLCCTVLLGSSYRLPLWPTGRTSRSGLLSHMYHTQDRHRR